MESHVRRADSRYRLQRTRDISGNDLANVEDRLNLQVVTRVWTDRAGRTRLMPR
ncbi:hypothetical protein [Streptomyces sp. NPDC005498]|uniref:hypothetical protein n=1 Tax=Streptomyces sp. NPDC005498 TaxID=3364717 RepID=UPI0036AC41F1